MERKKDDTFYVFMFLFGFLVVLLNRVNFNSCHDVVILKHIEDELNKASYDRENILNDTNNF